MRSTEEPPPAAQVVAAAKRLRDDGFAVSSLGNVSIRVGERIWITPSRVLARRLTDCEIATVGLDGAHHSGGEPSRELPLHLEIYRRFPESLAIVHSHSPWAVAWSHLQEDLARSTEELTYHCFARVSCARRHPSGSGALAVAAAAALDPVPVALLGAHGAVARAANLDDAFELCALAEQQAHVEWMLRLGEAARPVRSADGQALVRSLPRSPQETGTR